MNRIVSVDKMSKKARKERAAAQRGSWNGIRHCGTVFADRSKFRKAGRSDWKAAARAEY